MRRHRPQWRRERTPLVQPVAASDAPDRRCSCCYIERGVRPDLRHPAAAAPSSWRCSSSSGSRRAASASPTRSAGATGSRSRPRCSTCCCMLALFGIGVHQHREPAGVVRVRRGARRAARPSDEPRLPTHLVQVAPRPSRGIDALQPRRPLGARRRHRARPRGARRAVTAGSPSPSSTSAATRLAHVLAARRRRPGRPRRALPLQRASSTSRRCWPRSSCARCRST